MDVDDTLIAEHARRIADSARPPDDALDRIFRGSRQLRAKRWAAGVAATIAVVTGAVGAVSWLHTSADSAPTQVVPADGQSAFPVTGSASKAFGRLTGREVGIALGLTPVTDSVITGCSAFAEFRDGAGFCLEGVTDDKVELQLIADQINGTQRSPELEQYVRITQRMRNLENLGDAGIMTEEYRRLTAILFELHSTLFED